MSFLRLIARAAFAWIFISAGYGVMTNPGARVDLVAKSLPFPEPELLVRLNGASMVVGGTALALGIKPRLAAAGLAAALVPTTYVAHRYWEQSDPAMRRNHQVHFNKNVGLIGGLLSYALTEDS
ncbi:MAG TPA: DoxX family protein [Candidatus Dormibacteraeota bacterium]|nr:DoxX family protein [Candidatus Dormibacteraeota bacterium]